MHAEVDKAATAAERQMSTAASSRDLDRAGPLYRLAQRASDANKDVISSRAHARGQVTQTSIATSSTIIKLFPPTDLPRVFHFSTPYLVGGPDFPDSLVPFDVLIEIHPTSLWVLGLKWPHLTVCRSLDATWRQFLEFGHFMSRRK